MTRLLMKSFLLLILFYLPTSQAFDIPIHREMTVEQLGSITVTVGGDTLTFTDAALEMIADANEATDYVITGSAALFQPARHFTNDRFADSSRRLIDLRRDIVRVLTASSPPDGRQARELFGQALHTVQDFYSHSVWVELGNTGINTNFGRNVVANPGNTPSPCPAGPNTLGPINEIRVTTGYFTNPVTCGVPEDGLCHHGNWGISECVGINKDLDAVGAVQQGTVMSPFHAEARALAEQATLDYTQLILDEIGDNLRAVAAFFGVGTLGFVVDDTGSMGEEIVGVRSTVNNILGVIGSGPRLRVNTFLLERFGDPDIGPPLLSDDIGVVMSAVNGLNADGGGDCPELSQSALIEAIDTSSPNSLLFLYTDADAKDAGLGNTVISMANARGTIINYAITGTCAGLRGDGQVQMASSDTRATLDNIDPVYLRGARETGGQIFLLEPGELDQLTELVIPRLQGSSDTGIVTLVADELSAGTPYVADIPVDSSATALVVSATSDTANNLVLLRPSGELVDPSDPGVHIVQLTSGTIISVDQPETGVWNAGLEGSGSFTLKAEVTSPLLFQRFDFVQPGGDIHGGFLPIAGQPLLGREETGEATLFGPFTTANFRLVDLQGTPITNISLEQGFVGAARDHFLGEIQVPATAFRVMVDGVDTNGQTYQRVYPTMYRAQTIEVTSEPMTVSVPAGLRSDVAFSVQNLGPEGTFSLAAVASGGANVNLSVSEIVLNTGEQAQVIVTVAISPDAQLEDIFNITLTATRTDDTSVTNSGTALAIVALGSARPVPVNSVVPLILLILVLGVVASFRLRRGVKK